MTTGSCCDRCFTSRCLRSVSMSTRRWLRHYVRRLRMQLYIRLHWKTLRNWWVFAENHVILGIPFRLSIAFSALSDAACLLSQMWTNANWDIVTSTVRGDVGTVHLDLTPAFARISFMESTALQVCLLYYIFLNFHCNLAFYSFKRPSFRFDNDYFNDIVSARA